MASRKNLLHSFVNLHENNAFYICERVNNSVGGRLPISNYREEFHTKYIFKQISMCLYGSIHASLNLRRKHTCTWAIWWEIWLNLCFFPSMSNFPPSSWFSAFILEMIQFRRKLTRPCHLVALPETIQFFYLLYKVCIRLDYDIITLRSLDAPFVVWTSIGLFSVVLLAPSPSQDPFKHLGLRTYGV